MLLGALVDAGAELTVVQAALDAVVPGAVRVSATEVQRAGLRACKVDVVAVEAQTPHRSWAQIAEMLAAPPLLPPVRERAMAVFALLAEAEGAVHGIAPDGVHFHEVGALDSIADVVGVCAALEDLGVEAISASEIALGSGAVRSRHGQLPVPAPAVAQLVKGWRVRAGGRGELATPTGVALIRALADACEDLPAMTLEAVGIGAGSRDTPDRANVVRVLVADAADAVEAAVLLEANVDDLDPRLWPGVLTALLDAGASDAWLVPIVMKKGRPAHTLSVLCTPTSAPALKTEIFRQTSTLGVRESSRRKTVLDRCFLTVAVDEGTVAVKVGHQNGTIVQAMPEFADIAALAAATGRPQREILSGALAAATRAGLIPGHRIPG